MSDTKTKIIEATEKLIVAHGWDNVTFKMITSEAGINIAAINYHFGSREELENVLLERMVGAIERRRIALLEKIEAAAGNHPPEIRDVLRAFIEPVYEFTIEHPNHHDFFYNMFKGVVDKEKIQSRFRRNMLQAFMKFTATLSAMYPSIPRDRLNKRFIIMWFAPNLFLRLGPLKDLYREFDYEVDVEKITEETIDMLVAGIVSLEQESRIESEQCKGAHR